MDVLQQVRRWMDKEKVPRPGDHIIVGLSGGADSVCLLLCLQLLMKERRITVSAVHVNHQIRGTSAEEDAAFAEALSCRLQIPFHLRREDVPQFARQENCSLEEAGRLIRRRVLREEREKERKYHPKGNTYIALAHHGDDQAETLLMNLCRGTGIRGLGGIPPVQDEWIRPLLGCRREDITAWLLEQGESWREDESNSEDIYTRNRIRHHLIPWLNREVNDQASLHLRKLAEQAREVDLYLEEEALRWMDCRGRKEREEDTASVCWKFPIDELKVLPQALGKRILQRAMEDVSGKKKDITSRHLESIWQLLNMQSGRRISLPYGMTALRSFEELWLTTRSEAASIVPEDLGFHIKTRMFFREKGQKIPENPYTKWFDYDKIKWTLQFRFRETGDYLELAGGGHKSVKKYMIDAKIPAGKRNQIPVLAEENHVLWVVGYRVSAGYAVSDTTRRVLEVTVEKKNRVSQEEGQEVPE